MIKREVVMPVELAEEISEIVHKEGYTALKDAFPYNNLPPVIFLSREEAEALIVLAVIEKKKAQKCLTIYKWVYMRKPFITLNRLSKKMNSAI